MVIAAAMEAAGYIGRCFSAKDVTERSMYALQFSLLILAPVLMAACCYIVFGRILFLVVPKEARTFRLCWVSPRFITPIFVGCDIIALLLQLGGALMLSAVDVAKKNSEDTLNTGKRVAQVGVIIQLVAFGLFAVAAVRFNFTCRRFTKYLDERYASLGVKEHMIDGVAKDKNWPALLRVVNLTTILILVSIWARAATQFTC
ncbi:RTA-like protein [Penicillium paradoxum]|uniref:RTA-like protein n=1 Tax=Penicillium paradoxum TaxID=176176 RepID=UPI002547A34C|nr:RTA-like protein [Penicillium paradoxum]KAJ5780181.1 RTA-like protein [Penicillium paradoxum]